MLTDTHGHLYRFEVPSADLDGAIRRAEENGVKIILNAGVDLETSEKAVKVATLYSSVYACVGVHPWFANSFDSEVYGKLRDLTKEKKVVAISEVGLDFVGRREDVWSQTRAGIGNYLPSEIQIKTFTAHLKLAKEAKLPVIVHHNNSHREVLEILRQEDVSEIGGVIHGFSGDLETAEKYRDLGFYISIGKRGVMGQGATPDQVAALQKVIIHLPLERLVMETDSGESAEVKDVADRIAKLKEVGVEQVGSVTTSNMKKLLKL
ncbi:TatD family hydrolase [Candidatus Bathyarchaeota archaeon]|nr:TatD family hydrolase [Candidatus Bathyarchaeota archaeon]